MSRILRLPEVTAQTGLASRTIYSKIAAGDFPAPIKLGARAVGWPEAAIADWLTACTTAGKGGAE